MKFSLFIVLLPIFQVKDFLLNMNEMAPGQSVYYTPPRDKMVLLEPATLEIDAPASMMRMSEKISQANAEVDEVVQVMKTTVERVMERGESIQELESRATVLEEGAATFEMQATKLFDEMYWKENLKGILLLSCLVAIFFLIFISKYCSLRSNVD